MAGRRVHFVMPDELVTRVDAAAEAARVSRGEFVRRAVERALGEFGALGAGGVDTRSPAPAEQPDTRAMDLLREDDPDPDFVARGRVPEFPPRPAAREFRPYPKGGKR